MQQGYVYTYNVNIFCFLALFMERTAYSLALNYSADIPPPSLPPQVRQLKMVTKYVQSAIILKKENASDILAQRSGFWVCLSNNSDCKSTVIK